MPGGRILEERFSEFLVILAQETLLILGHCLLDCVVHDFVDFLPRGYLLLLESFLFIEVVLKRLVSAKQLHSALSLLLTFILQNPRLLGIL